MTSIPQSFRHNISLLLDQHSTDASRIIDIGADAIRAARQALDAMPADVSIGDIFQDIAPVQALIKAVQARAVLEPEFSDIVDEVLEQLPAAFDERNPIERCLASAKADLLEAKYYANRYLDLIVSEAQRAQTRGSH
ncbi:hypothetical protein SAMN04515647_1194 [Cohaesibacter sp. ES.047]|uniref:hypothetical protein n=1 Tax=Cohaesibacter sp. ES.047 TaxID=1798205 RepID=UPI000BB9178A|nr:hypothetical protein [Cohaesibacter sp. ES.047]SNY91001.1 hypothetical protein SAMN04515647_1194 [Cohaesibacter sp. ES.047]